MSSHRRVRNFLYEYLRGELSPEDRAAIESHLAACSRCREELENLRSAFEVMPPDALRPDTRRTAEFWQSFASRVEARVQLEKQSKRTSRSALWESIESAIMLRPGFTAAAAGALALLGVAVLSWHLLTRVTPEGQQPQIAQEAAVDSSALLDNYLRRSKILLVGITNLNPPEGEPVDLSAERRVSRQLIEETKSLKQRPLDARSAILVDNLEKVFNELATANEEAGFRNVELVRSTIRQQNLLFKIRMAETMHESMAMTRTVGNSK